MKEVQEKRKKDVKKKVRKAGTEREQNGNIATNIKESLDHTCMSPYILLCNAKNHSYINGSMLRDIKNSSDEISNEEFVHHIQNKTETPGPFSYSANCIV